MAAFRLITFKSYTTYIFKQLIFVMWTVNGFCSIVLLHPFGWMAVLLLCHQSEMKIYDLQL